MSAYSKIYRERGAGGFTRRDGTIEFYSRVNALLNPDMVIVDLGAGRGRSAEDSNRFRRSLSILKGKVRKVIGVDIDDSVLTNKIVDEAIVFDGTTLPLPNQSVDVIVSDWTFEHIADPRLTEAEIWRTLKPGGWLCARTPHTLSLAAIASRLVPNRLHAKVIGQLQPDGRDSHDVFPTFYRLNSISAVSRVFPESRWTDYSYTYSSEPSYNFGSKRIVRMLCALQYIKGVLAGENLFVFMQKA